MEWNPKMIEFRSVVVVRVWRISNWNNIFKICYCVCAFFEIKFRIKKFGEI